jgi:hypothetical protein
VLVARTSCATVPAAPPAALLTSAAQPGDVVSLSGLDEATVPCLPVQVCRPIAAATMLFSDDPEAPAIDGVLYADTFGPGHARLYVYHVNSGAAARKFPIVVLNQQPTDAHVTITKRGLGAPGTDYVSIGKAAATAWQSSNIHEVVTVPAGARVVLDAALDGVHATKNQLVHAILDVEVDAAVKISVVSVLATADTATLTGSLPLLDRDGLHDRGTFAGGDVWLVGSAGGEGPSARHVRIGDQSTEPDLTGSDATTGAAARLRGNYGVVYRFLIAVAGPVRVAASARGGAWAGSVDAGTPVALPSASGGLATTSDAVWLATLAGPADLMLVSGGGSSLPLDVVVLTP